MIHRSITVGLCALLLACAPSPTPSPTPSAASWYRGNLHTHSLWTDGTDFPEMIADWYKSHGYNFLAITEHDMLQGGEKWVDVNAKDEGWPPRNASARKALDGYRAQFGPPWLIERHEDGKHLVRLRGLEEYRQMFDEPNRFLLVMAEEITDRQGAHMNGFNLEAAVLPRGGANPAERIRNNLAAVAEQQAKQRAPLVTIINHPNYLWALRAEELAATDARLFEVYNGHTMTNSEGDSVHPDTDRMWDIMLTERQRSGRPPIYGVASDDAHDYRAYGDTISRPGRGWVMVRADRLAADDVARALAAGDFYATTGITLRALRTTADELSIEIAAEPGVTYRTQFIGTRTGAAATTGEILAEVAGPFARYRFKGDERYVRARIVSSRPHLDAIGGELLEPNQRAWVQPVFR
jgi:hypothetical protein